jgi:hypothetical protein
VAIGRHADGVDRLDHRGVDEVALAARRRNNLAAGRITAALCHGRAAALGHDRTRQNRTGH